MNKVIGIVICHKSLAFELLETAAAVLGQSDDLYAFSNEKVTTEEAVHQLKELLTGIGQNESVIFMTDLRGGNCWAIAQRMTRQLTGSFVLSGVNLPMIFSFLTKKYPLAVKELVKVMENDAHRGIVLE